MGINKAEHPQPEQPIQLVLPGQQFGIGEKWFETPRVLIPEIGRVYLSGLSHTGGPLYTDQGIAYIDGQVVQGSVIDFELQSFFEIQVSIKDFQPTYAVFTRIILPNQETLSDLIMPEFDENEEDPVDANWGLSGDWHISTDSPQKVVFFSDGKNLDRLRFKFRPVY